MGGPVRRQPELDARGVPRPCDRCHEQTLILRRLYGGHVVPVCEACWQNTFDAVARARIAAANMRLEATTQRCGVCDWPLRPGEVSRPVCAKCKRRPIPRPRRKAAAPRKDIYTFGGIVRGGAPGLGKRS